MSNARKKRRIRGLVSKGYLSADWKEQRRPALRMPALSKEQGLWKRLFAALAPILARTSPGKLSTVPKKDRKKSKVIDGRKR